ncbi:MAG: hypothetical protein QOF78_972 [Phycisphaerales bacterium]|jgi:hypothetical protein|nr:hypothetical protein [Phycisphaerales bacterium]
MATIANLNVKLTAGIGGFATSMSKAGRHVTSFGGSILSNVRQVIGWGGALAAVATGGGLAMLVKKELDAIDATAKLSDRMGIATEQLVGLQHAADLAGIDSEGLTGSLEKMLKFIGTLAEDGGKGEAVLKKLGLSSAELANLSPDKTFTLIADRLSKVTSAYDRAKIASDIFGRAGQQLEPLLLGGADGIAAAQAEAEKLGLTFSRLDAAKIEEANDQLSRVQGILAGAGRAAAIELAPAIAGLSQKLIDSATAGEGLGAKVAGAIEWAGGALATASDVLELFKSGWFALKGVAGVTLLGIVGPLNLVIQGIDWLVNKLTGSSTAFAGFAQGMTDGFVDETKQAFADAGESFTAFADGKNSKAVSHFFAGVRANADAAAKSIADAAAKMNGGAFTPLPEAKKTDGKDAGLFSDDTLGDVFQNVERITDAISDMQKEIDQASMTPLAKKLDDLKRLGANSEELGIAETRLKTIDQRKLSAAAADSPGAASIEVGGAAAQRFAFENARGVDVLGKDEVPKKQLKEQEAATGVLTEINHNIRVLATPSTKSIFG